MHWLAGMKAAAAGVEALGAEWEVATASGSEEGGGRFELEKEVRKRREGRPSSRTDGRGCQVVQHCRLAVVAPPLLVFPRCDPCMISSSRIPTQPPTCRRM